MNITECVAGLYFNAGEVLLIKRQQPPWHAGLWNATTGRIEQAEMAPYAMARHFENATGIHTTPARWLKFAEVYGPDLPETGKAHQPYIVSWFRADRINTDSACVKRADEPAEYWDVSCLPHMLVPALQWLIPMARMPEFDCWPYRIRELHGRP